MQLGTVEGIKRHAVCVPFPAQGHVTPMMQLAKLLHSTGFHITFVNTEFNQTRLVRSKGPDSVNGLPDFRFETIPDGLPPSTNFNATQDAPSLCDSTRKNCFDPFIELVRRLNSLVGVPPVSCIISDGTMSFCIKAAEKLGIRQVQFWTASACSFMAYLHYNELERRSITPYKVADFLNNEMSKTPIDWIPGMTNLRLKDMPTFITTSNNAIMYDFLGSEALNCLTSSAIIFNTFDEFEYQVLQAIAAHKFNGKIYTIGPLNLLSGYLSKTESKIFGSSLWREDSTCVHWLDRQETKSVVYVNYGSITTMSEKDLHEFAWGLVNSKHPFLWIIREDIVNGDCAILPQELLNQIKCNGFLASWCQQEQVLTHPSIGVFLTHCGWNSTLEAISRGVPIICWPFFADQQTNCRYVCCEWGNGVELNHDVTRNEIEQVVKKMMEGDEGKQKRQKALEWMKKAEEATSIGGSSYNNFGKLIKEALYYDED